MAEAETGSAKVDEQTHKKKNRVLSKTLTWFAHFIFYAIMFVLLAVVYITSMQADTGKTRSFFGYSMYIVLTGSMRAEIPEESFVLVKEVDPSTIQVDDDITFVRSDKKIVTHRVVEIFEDYMQSGLRGFRTKGLNNPEPDQEVVYADNMIGKVVFFNAAFGIFLTWAKGNILLLLSLVAMLIVFMYVVGYLMTTKDNGTAIESTPEQNADAIDAPDAELDDSSAIAKEDPDIATNEDNEISHD